MRFNVFPEARTSEILCKPTKDQNHRLTRGLSAVYQRFISGVRSALCSWLTFNEEIVELVNGDPEVVVRVFKVQKDVEVVVRVFEVQKDVEDVVVVVVVVVAVDPPVGAAGRLGVRRRRKRAR